MACPTCGKESKNIVAVGMWPRCQHRAEGRRYDPNSQCVFGSRHNGCHKSSDNVWTCT